MTASATTYFVELKSKVRTKLLPLILKKTAEKALNDAATNVAVSLLEAGADFDEYFIAYQADEIFNPQVLINGGKLLDFVSAKWQNLFLKFYDKRSIGFGTPNAASGEGELAALCSSPRVKVSKKSGRGDLLIDGVKVELKGGGARIAHSTQGTDFKTACDKIGMAYGFAPNKVNGGRLAFEPLDISKSKVKQWDEALASVSAATAVSFITEIMCATGSNFTEAQVARFFKNGKLNRTLANKALVKAFFRFGCETGASWDRLTCIIDGHVYVIANNADAFDKLVDDDIVVVHGKPQGKALGQYFRLFQRFPLSFYYGFNTAS